MTKTTKEERDAFKRVMKKIKSAKLPKGWSKECSYPRTRAESFGVSLKIKK